MWKIFNEAGVFVHNPDFADANAFATKLQAAGFGWCAVYVHEGTTEKNDSWLAAHDWGTAMRAHGITFGLWGWCDEYPAQCAALAANLVDKYDDPAHSVFYIANAEAAYKADIAGGARARSQQFVTEFRRRKPSRQAALSTYGAAVWDNNMAGVFDYNAWRTGKFDLLPQAYFNDAAEYEPMHCVRHGLAAGYALADIHPTVASYTSPTTGWRFGGDRWAYLLKNCTTTGWSVFNAENLTDADLASLALVAP